MPGPEDTSLRPPPPPKPSLQTTTAPPRPPNTPPPPTYSPVTPELQPSFPVTTHALPPTLDNSSSTLPSVATASIPPTGTAPRISHAHPPPPPHPQPQPETAQRSQKQPPRLHLKGPAPPPPPPPQPPPPESLSLEENPDAIALRAALGILQMQRRTAVEDVKTLQRQKKEAVQDLPGFAKGITERSVKMRDGGIIPFNPELRAGGYENEGRAGTGGEGGRAEGEGMEMEMQIPSAQKVVRMPKVEWGKYHVVGAALDRLHEGERRGEVAREYNPFVDRLDEGKGREGVEGGGWRKSGVIGERPK